MDARVLDAGGCEKKLHDAARRALIDTILARHAPRGASTSTVSPTTRPTSARPSGESGETLPAPMTLEISISMRAPSSIVDHDDRADPDLVRIELRRVDQHGVVEARAQLPNARLEQTLLVLRGVIFEVLGQVAVLTRRLDRLNDGRARRPLQLGKLVGQRLPLRRCQLIDSRFAQD